MEQRQDGIVLPVSCWQVQDSQQMQLRIATFDACMLIFEFTVVGEDDMMSAYPEGKASKGKRAMPGQHSGRAQEQK